MTPSKETETKTQKTRKVNVFDDQGGEDDAPNAAFTAALELAKQATSSPGETPQVQEQGRTLSHISSKPEKQKSDRAGEGYTKATYRVRNEATDAVEDMRLLLKRTYGIKALREEIVEEAILAAQRDLLENGETSFLVRNLREIENQ